MMGDSPGISCICPTFGRPNLLEEALNSFLLQDFEGEKELLILNDFAAETLRFDHPEVTVVNVPARFRSLGEKRNAAVALCRHDLITVWDDDDVSLPHRLRYSMAHYEENKRFYCTTKYFVVQYDRVESVEMGPSHSNSMWHRTLFDEMGGYRALHVGEDADLQRRFLRSTDWDGSYETPDSDVFYLRRWRGTGSFHTQSIGFHDPVSTRDKIAEYVRNQVRRGEIPEGEVVLTPHWTRDWVSIARHFVESQQQGAPAAAEAPTS